MLPPCPAGPHTHSLEEACALIGCESPDWIVDRVRNGTFPGRKIVRAIRFSDDDIRSIIEACAVQSRPSVQGVPTPTRSMRRAG